MLRFLYFFCVMLLFPIFSAQAQLLNVEGVRTSGDSAGWYGELEFDLALKGYNERVLEFTNESNLSYFSDRHAYMLLNSLNFVNIDGNSLISSGYLHLRSTFLRKGKWSPEAFTQYQYNRNLGLNDRALAGAGIKYRFHRSKKWQASISTAFMYEFEEWQLADQPFIKNEYFKSSSNISLRGTFSDTASLLLIGYYQARPDQFFKARSIVETELEMDITKRVAVSISFVASYDAAPIIDIPNLTYELSNGLVIKL
ncbi:MAG TPA: hypothetical protein DD671_12115 [Balneolaceae bacterium]|nr:hypothetical protein [Balneolaceae bacterium]